MKLTVNQAEKLRAIAYVDGTREAMTEGIMGAEDMPPLQTLAEWQATDQAVGLEATLRRAFYAQLAGLRTTNFDVYEPTYGANWGPLGGSFDSRILLWVDAFGLKHIEGICARSGGAAVDNEVMFELPGFMVPAQDGKILLVATANGVGRVDIIGNQVTWQTTGGYAGGSGYCSFDPVPAYR